MPMALGGEESGTRAGGLDTEYAAVLDTHRTASSGPDGLGATQRGRAGNIPAVVDADGAVDPRDGADAKGSVAPTCCKRPAIDNADGAVPVGRLHTNGPNNCSAYDSDIAAIDDAYRTIEILRQCVNAQRVTGTSYNQIAAIIDADRAVTRQNGSKNALREAIGAGASHGNIAAVGDADGASGATCKAGNASRSVDAGYI
jgi:hypothetical protein